MGDDPGVESNAARRQAIAAVTHPQEIGENTDWAQKK